MGYSKYRIKDTCYMGENGKIIDDIHLTSSGINKKIDIPMTELLYLEIHLELDIAVYFENVKAASDEEEEKKYEVINHPNGHIKLYFINPIQNIDKTASSRNNAKLCNGIKCI